MTLQIINGPVIEAGQVDSEPIEITTGELVRITMPAGWSHEAVLTFLISSDGQGFNPLLMDDGSSVDVRVKPGAAVIVPNAISRALGWVKFHSGTHENPVPQDQRREFAMAILIQTVRVTP